jgi:hypothetical protein
MIAGVRGSRTHPSVGRRTHAVLKTGRATGPHLLPCFVTRSKKQEPIIQQPAQFVNLIIQNQTILLNIDYNLFNFYFKHGHKEKTNV